MYWCMNTKSDPEWALQMYWQITVWLVSTRRLVQHTCMYMYMEYAHTHIGIHVHVHVYVLTFLFSSSLL
jgi:hypothetical protein